MPPNDGRQWNSTLTRRTPLHASRNARPPRTPLNKVGKKGKARQKGNKVIDAELARHGIQHCEAGLEGCLGSFMLQRAHSKKGRNMKPGDIEEAILACQCCHSVIELWPEARMTKFVRERIAARGV